MYQAWLYCGEYLVLGIWGIMLTLVRRILFGELCKDAALGNKGKGKMLKAMTLKFEKSCEVKVGIHDIPVFVQKYLCQEKKFGIPLARWRRLPERWTGLILGIGIVESMVLRYLKYDTEFCLNRFLAALTAAAAVYVFILLLEADSLWERAGVCLLDYVSNTLYSRQVHEYEGFGEEETVAEESKEITADPEEKTAAESGLQVPEKKVLLEKDEERIFQEVLSDFLGSST